MGQEWWVKGTFRGSAVNGPWMKISNVIFKLWVFFKNSGTAAVVLFDQQCNQLNSKATQVSKEHFFKWGVSIRKQFSLKCYSSCPSFWEGSDYRPHIRGPQVSQWAESGSPRWEVHHFLCFHKSIKSNSFTFTVTLSLSLFKMRSQQSVTASEIKFQFKASQKV